MRRGEALAIVLLLLALLAIGLAWPAPHAAGEVPALSGPVPQELFVRVSIPQNAGMPVDFPQPEPAGSGGGPAASGQDTVAEPAVPSAPVTGNSPRPTPRTRPAARVIPAARSGTRVAGIASTYGPGFDGWLALPEGAGVRVTICGPAACIVRTSTDAGPSLAMQRLGRIVDLSVRDFELVSGGSWRIGLVRVTVTR